MTSENKKIHVTLLHRIVAGILNLPWLNIFINLWQELRLRLSVEGVYQVLEYDSTLELLTTDGREAKFSKREKVRYLQNATKVYEDQAWGDGEILLDYRCSPGYEVDRYRLSNKTQILISLRGTRKRGDVDEFNVEWGIKDGFTTSLQQWGTEVSHDTKHLKIQIIFPSGRPPMKVWLVEYSNQQEYLLKQDSISKLNNGRWLVRWETRKPKQFEQYIVKWKW